MLTRRDILKSALCLPFAVELLNRSTNAQGMEYPMSGQATPGFEAMDYQMTKWLRENQKPGGVLVISYQGRLIYARGFGYADTKTQRPFLATTPLWQCSEVVHGDGVHASCRTGSAATDNSNNDLDPGNGPLNDIVLHTLDKIQDKPQIDLWTNYSQ